MRLADKLAQEWHQRLSQELCQHGESHVGIVQWLLGEQQDQFEEMNESQRTIARQAMDYRYRILVDRYLNASPDRAYRNLIQRLSGLFLLRNKIRTWISLSRDRQRSVVDVLQEVIQELMQQDSYLQQQIAWISRCTDDPRLRNALVLATTEEYCLRPIRNQPLLMYRFVNYLRRSQRGGMTQVPSADFIRLVSEEVNPDESEGSVSLLDGQAVIEYQDAQSQQEQQEVRENVVGQLSAYLDDKVGPEASQWLRLYLQGKTQESIAESLNMPIKQVYRLREKVSYHAIKVFATKKQPELVTEWLGR